MNKPVQFITTPSGERLVVLSEEDYQRMHAELESSKARLEEALEDVEDLKALVDGLRREQEGEEMLTLEELDAFLEKERQRQSS